MLCAQAPKYLVKPAPTSKIIDNQRGGFIYSVRSSAKISRETRPYIKNYRQLKLADTILPITYDLLPITHYLLPSQKFAVRSHPSVGRYPHKLRLLVPLGYRIDFAIDFGSYSDFGAV